jgi:A/G-specific adenine glycosylase
VEKRWCDVSLTRLQRSLLDWYRHNGRAALPWRVARDPYATLVSEFMLQQTQVDRVVPIFQAFVRRFPDVRALAAAPAGAVLRAWKGLGYNSRAVRLKRVAETVVERYGGVLPSEQRELEELPGIGPYTAAAIRAFAFDLDTAAVDTNVRRVVGRLIFGGAAGAREIDDRARALVPSGSAHDWNSAMMDLGASICTARAPKCLLCPLQRECAAAPLLETANVRPAARKSPPVAFEKTARYARGRLIDRLRELPQGQCISLLDLHRDLRELLPESVPDDIRSLVLALERDGLVSRDGECVSLPE